jgi:hypothetical protein
MDSVATSARFRFTGGRFAQQSADFVNQHSLLLLVIICGSFLAASLTRDRFQPLWQDEFLTLAVAKTGTWTGILNALSSGADFNPPLHYWMAAATMSVFGESSVALRLPATLGFVTFLVCLFIFARRRMPPLIGLIATLIPICMATRSYAWDARPYGLLLGYLGVSLVAWQAASERTLRFITIPILSLALIAAAFTHYYGLLLILPFAAAEACRQFLQRRLDGPMIAALLLPFCVPLVLLNLIRTQKAYLQHAYFTDVSPFDLLRVYGDFAMEPALIVALACIVLLLSRSPASAQPPEGQHQARGFLAPEIVVVVVLASLPVIGLVAARAVTHVYIYRYFIGAIGGISLAFAAAIFAGARRYPAIGFWSAAVLCAYVLLFSAYQVRSRPVNRASGLAQVGSSEGPILIENTNDYLVARYYEPALRARLWYIADPRESFRLLGYDANEIPVLALKKLEGLQVDSFDGFTSLHPTFTFVPSSGGNGYVLRDLLERHFQLTANQLVDGAVVYSVTRPVASALTH